MKRFAIIMMCAMALMIQTASATTVEIAVIDGVVYDTNTGYNVNEATVTVNCSNGNSESYVTGSNGYYAVTLLCPIGSTVTVKAAKETVGSAKESAVLMKVGRQSIGDLTIDVGIAHANLGIGIPEFPVGFLPAMMTVLGVGLVRRKF